MHPAAPRRARTDSRSLDVMPFARALRSPRSNARTHNTISLMRFSGRRVNRLLRLDNAMQEHSRRHVEHGRLLRAQLAGRAEQRQRRRTEHLPKPFRVCGLAGVDNLELGVAATQDLQEACARESARTWSVRSAM